MIVMSIHIYIYDTSTLSIPITRYTGDERMCSWVSILFHLYVYIYIASIAVLYNVFVLFCVVLFCFVVFWICIGFSLAAAAGILRH